MVYYKSLLLSALALGGTAVASSVLDLTVDNFDASIFQKTPSLVEFFAPWCGHCKKLAPVYDELADSFSHATSKIIIGKVDGDEHKSLSSKYGISGFPTLKWFDGTSETPVDYTGGRDLEALQAFITEKTGAKPKKKFTPPSEVTLLTDQSFDGAVGKDKDVFVAFTAPWCGHCKTLAPIWEKLATDFSPEPSVVIAKVDAEANKAVAESYGVKGYPTIKFFPRGSAVPVDYSGAREEAALVDFVNGQSGTHRAVGGGLDISAGTVEALDALVSKISGGASSLDSITADVKAAALGLAEGVQGKYAEYYVKVLDKIAANQGYVEKELGRLEGLLRKGGLARGKIDEITGKVNVLRRFVGFGGKDEL